jgi:IS1 family transposase
MNRLNIEQRAKILGCMVEGNSVRATSRLLGVDKKTVLRLLAEFGSACQQFHDKTVRNLKSKRVQCDEIWSFVYSKEKNVPEKCKGVFGFGSVYTWTALCADTKLIIGYRVDRRDEEAAHAFIHDLSKRLTNRVQLSTDGHHAYLHAVEDTFGGDIDYAMIRKIYNAPGGRDGDGRYSPGECCGIKKKKIIGQPVRKDISTSYVERMNLNIRMGQRRFTRLTNAFSKKVENHIYAIAIYFMYYNFCRIHQTLRVTPAMEAGLTDHVWTLEEIVQLAEPKPALSQLVPALPA